MASTRRDMMKAAAGTGIGVLVLPNGLKAAASGKLNLALIGAWGRGKAHHGVAKDENVVALCDVNKNNLAQAAKTFPNTNHYEDWRKLFDKEKKLDGVICATCDHTHAYVANWALNRDLHVYCEKPLANTVEEARVVRANYLKRKMKVATQVGTQRHAIENFNRVYEAVHDGAVGTLKEAFAWGNRQIRGDSYLPAEGSPPDYLNWDLWLGPSPYHPYNKKYMGGCLAWNKYWDFGSGQVGDMGSHTMDLAWKPLHAELPLTAAGEGGKFNPDIAPVELHTWWDMPKNEHFPQIKLHWYQGGMLPKSPNPETKAKIGGHGAMFLGDKGFIVAGFGNMDLYPLPGGNLDHYKPRPKEKQLPKMGSFQGQWIRAAKSGDKTATSCNFDYAGKLIETMLLGLVAFRIGKPFKYDGKTGKADVEEANKHMSRPAREGWKLDG